MPLTIVYIAVLLALAVLVLRSDHARGWLRPYQEPPRRVTAATAALLFGLGLFFLRALVADSGDNAYLYILMLGMWLIADSIPFALATLAPVAGLRRAATLIGLFLLVVPGVFSLFILVWALVIIPSQGYEGSQVFVSHLVGLLAMVGAIAAVLAGYRVFRVR